MKNWEKQQQKLCENFFLIKQKWKKKKIRPVAASQEKNFFFSFFSVLQIFLTKNKKIRNSQKWAEKWKFISWKSGKSEKLRESWKNSQATNEAWKHQLNVELRKRKKKKIFLLRSSIKKKFWIFVTKKINEKFMNEKEEKMQNWGGKKV